MLKLQRPQPWPRPRRRRPWRWRRLRLCRRLRSLPWLSLLPLRSARFSLRRRRRALLALPLRPPFSSSFSPSVEEDEADEPEPLFSSLHSLSSSSSLLSSECELQSELGLFSDLLRRLRCLTNCESFSSPVFSSFFFLEGRFSEALLSLWALSGDSASPPGFCAFSSSLRIFFSFFFLCFGRRTEALRPRAVTLSCTVSSSAPAADTSGIDRAKAALAGRRDGESAALLVTGGSSRGAGMSLMPAGSASSGMDSNDASSVRDAIFMRSSLFSSSRALQREASSESVATLARRSSRRAASLDRAVILACRSRLSEVSASTRFLSSESASTLARRSWLSESKALWRLASAERAVSFSSSSLLWALRVPSEEAADASFFLSSCTSAVTASQRSCSSSCSFAMSSMRFRKDRLWSSAMALLSHAPRAIDPRGGGGRRPASLWGA
mmetsp:Transcript_17940/g.54501  ORF Transcript_17940/g.54501 Transcript_17940/m.54501 type:complete len:440 (-) Transcript_17940:4-1323(-)